MIMAGYGRGLSQLLLVAIAAQLSSGALASDCQVTLSRPVVDYGHLTPGDGQKAIRGSLYALSESEVVVSAYCAMPQEMALFFSGTPKDGGFLFGSNGVLGVEASQATLDGASVKLGKTSGQRVVALSGSAGDRVVVSNNDGLVPVINQALQEGQRFSVVLRLKPLMNASGLKPADQTLLKSDLNIRVDTE
ncbi:hypothetical protein ACU60T_25275 [Klebsiella aerogenes]